jgi:hypothetical protein
MSSSISSFVFFPSSTPAIVVRGARKFFSIADHRDGTPDIKYIGRALVR